MMVRQREQYDNNSGNRIDTRHNDGADDADNRPGGGCLTNGPGR